MSKLSISVLVQIIDINGKTHSCGALLDTGPKSNLITEDFCEKLKLKMDHTNISLVGIV